ncbi:hypothetical protein PR202_ga21758 [Eleusine coracana subsp. coracana]|uniref:Uncharacterized protein n=1 Tax=Eleusine coracana subsp. coracana TaxID=191504 RepID=A0AAV5D0G2_ELECO|nr:hypothetical protein PR202_ga21758 [Eleusine coracana subsp. coracana]
MSAAGDEFTADDLAAADQLVQLSVSGGGEEEACSSSALSSPRSVNNTDGGLVASAAQDDENAGVVDRRARKRYRLVSELYAATRRVSKSDYAGGDAGKRKGTRDGIRMAN